MIALCIAPLAAAAAALGSLPDTIALHAGVHGVIDRYGSKYERCDIAAILGVFPTLLSCSSLGKRLRLFAKGTIHGVDSPRSARILFLVIGSIETIIAIGVVLSFGRGALAG
ncbi:MAG: DUF1648 domain-containing protein [Eggerthella lenta]